MPYLKKILDKEKLAAYFSKFTQLFLGENLGDFNKEEDELMVAFTLKVLQKKSKSILNPEGLALYERQKEGYDNLLVDAAKSLDSKSSPLLAYYSKGDDLFLQAITAEFKAYLEGPRSEYSLIDDLAAHAVVSASQQEEKPDLLSQLPIDVQLSRIEAEITRLRNLISSFQKPSNSEQTKADKDLKAIALQDAQRKLSIWTQKYKFLSSLPVINESQAGGAAFWKTPVIPVTTSYGKATYDATEGKPKPYSVRK